MTNLVEIARAHIAPPSRTQEVRFERGSTQDIITVILDADRLAAPYTKEFAPYVDAGSVRETCRRLHAFVQDNITYQEDPAGVQCIKSPSMLFSTGVGDCKSFSVFIASVLGNLGIPYRYRFASYKARGEVTHVYVVATDEKGNDVLVDAVPPIAFGKQAPSAYTVDYDPATGQKIGQASNHTAKASAPLSGTTLVLALLAIGLLFTLPTTR